MHHGFFTNLNLWIWIGFFFYILFFRKPKKGSGIEFKILFYMVYIIAAFTFFLFYIFLFLSYRFHIGDAAADLSFPELHMGFMMGIYFALGVTAFFDFIKHWFKPGDPPPRRQN